jgi:hypothetical protein
MFTIFSEVCASGKYRNHFEHERTGGIWHMKSLC